MQNDKELRHLSPIFKEDFWDESIDQPRYLIIGIGTTGTEAVRKFKKKICKLYKGRLNFNTQFLNRYISLFCFDPAGGNFPDLNYGEIYTPSVNIKKLIDETLSGELKSDYIEKNKDIISNLRGISEEEMKGAGTIRPLAKFLFEKVAGEFIERFRNKFKELGAKKIRCILVGSIHGGTCSGTFIDMALLLKSIEKELKKTSGYGEEFHLDIWGLFTLPGLTPSKDDKKESANAWAALKELEEIWKKGQSSYELKSFYKKSEFNTIKLDKYPAHPLFQYIFVIERLAGETHVGEDKVDDALSQFLLYISHPQIWDVHIRPWLADRMDKLFEKGEFLSSFKIETFEIPISLWSEYTKYQVCSDIIRDLSKPEIVFDTCMQNLERRLSLSSPDNLTDRGTLLNEVNKGLMGTITKIVTMDKDSRPRIMLEKKIKDEIFRKIKDTRGIDVRNFINKVPTTNMLEVEQALQNISESDPAPLSDLKKTETLPVLKGEWENKAKENLSELEERLKKLKNIIMDTINQLQKEKAKAEKEEETITGGDLKGFLLRGNLKNIVERYYNLWAELYTTLVEYLNTIIKYKFLKEKLNKINKLNNRITVSDRILNEYRKEMRETENQLDNYIQMGDYFIIYEKNIFESELKHISNEIKKKISDERDIVEDIKILTGQDYQKAQDVKDKVERYFNYYAEEYRHLKYPEQMRIETIFEKEKGEINPPSAQMISKIRNVAIDCIDLNDEEKIEQSTDSNLKVILFSNHEETLMGENSAIQENIDFLKGEIRQSPSPNIIFATNVKTLNDKLFKITVITFFFGFSPSQDITEYRNYEEKGKRLLQNKEWPSICFPELWDDVLDNQQSTKVSNAQPPQSSTEEETKNENTTS